MSEPAPRTLRPMSVADLVDEIFRLYRGNFSLLFGVAAIVSLPSTILITIGATLLGDIELIFLEGLGAEHYTGIATIVLGVVVLLVTFPILVGALTHAVAQRHIDRPAGIVESLLVGLRRFLRIVGATVLVLSIMIGFLALLTLAAAFLTLGLGVPNVLVGIAYGVVALVGLFWIVVTWQFTPQAIIIERAGVIASLRRSMHLVKRSRWRVIGINLLLALIGTVLLSAPAILLTLFLEPLPLLARNALEQLISILAQVLFYPVQLGTLTMLYFDLRVRREGYDLALAAERLRPQTGSSG